MKSWKVEDVLSFRRPTGIAISPDGETVLFSLRELDTEEGAYREKLWKVDTKGQTAPVQLTQTKSMDTEPVVSPDGNWLAFLSDRSVDDDDDKDDEVEHRLYVLPLKGGEAIRISASLRNIYDFAFAPNGQGVYVITDVEETPYETYLRKSAEEDKRDVMHEDQFQRARRICHVPLPPIEVCGIKLSGAEVSGGEVSEAEILPTEVSTIYQHDYGLLQLTVSDDGQFIVFVSNYTGLANDEDKSDLWLLDQRLSGAYEASPLVQREGACLMPSISPDGRFVAYIAPRGDKRELSHSDAWLVDVKTGRTRNISMEADCNGDIESVAWISNSSFVANSEERLYAPIVRFDIQETASSWSYVTSPTAVARTFDIARKSEQVAFLQASSDEPNNVFVTSVTGGAVYQCTNLHVKQENLPRGRVQRFAWPCEASTGTGFDVTELEGLLVLPNEKMAGSGPYPLLVDIHGGPAYHTTLSFDHSHLNSHFFASLGYAVFSPNYRGSTGYGDAFVKANFEDLGGGDYRDIVSGIDALIAAGLVDASKIGVMGASYGGYMTNWMIGHDHRFQAAVSECGIWNLFTDFGCSSQRTWELTYVGSYWEKESLYLERSPARYVQNIETPVLIVHGEADDNTFISNSKEMYNALVEAGKTVEFVHYPREGHGLDEPRHQEDELRRIMTWFLHYIPTECTVGDVPFGKTVDVPHTGLTVGVVQARFTEEYRLHGDGYERMIEVDLMLGPSPTDDGEQTSVSLQVDHPATSDIWLGFSGVETHQKPSIFPKQKILPKAIVLGNGCLASGDLTLSLHITSTVRLLFAEIQLDSLDLTAWHLHVGTSRFSLARLT